MNTLDTYVSAPVVPAQGDAGGDAAGQGARAGGGGQGDHGDLAAGAEVVDGPVVALGVVAKVGVGVDRVRVADEREHGQVVAGVAVGGAAVEEQVLAVGEGADGLGLGGAVEQVADQFAGVVVVDRFGDGAQGAGEAEAVGHDPGDLDGGGGDEPDLLA